VGELPSAGAGWLATLILGVVWLVTKMLERRTARQADKERTPIEGFSKLAESQEAWQAQLLERQAQLIKQIGEHRAETEALLTELADARRELAASRREVAALRKQIKESG